MMILTLRDVWRAAGKERGWGLRCARDMREGEFVCEYAGEVITTEEAVRVYT